MRLLTDDGARDEDPHNGKSVFHVKDEGSSVLAFASVEVVPFHEPMLHTNKDKSQSLHIVLGEPLDVGWDIDQEFGLLAVANSAQSANTLVNQIGKDYFRRDDLHGVMTIADHLYATNV